MTITMLEAIDAELWDSAYEGGEKNRRKLAEEIARVALQHIGDALMGAKDVAEALGVKVPNLKHVKIEPVARISGGAIPVYLRADVEAEKARRAEKRAAVAE